MAFVFARGSEMAETATLLLAIAREKGIDEWAIRVVHDGFEVPDELLSETDRKVVEKTPAAPAEEAPAPKRRGRPAGSKNAPKPDVAKEDEPESPAQDE